MGADVDGSRRITVDLNKPDGVVLWTKYSAKYRINACFDRLDWLDTLNSEKACTSQTFYSRIDFSINKIKDKINDSGIDVCADCCSYFETPARVSTVDIPPMEKVLLVSIYNCS